FIFASEIKAILQHPAVTPALNEEALYHYPTFVTTPPPQTLFADVGKLPAGHLLTIDRHGEVNIKQYWDALPSAAAAPDLTEAEHEANILRLLRESVGKRMMSDVPFGVFLSGGLDSSTNVALMAELSDAPVRTYSTAPRGHARYDELANARIVAERFGTEHHEVLIDEQEMRDFLPEMLYH